VICVEDHQSQDKLTERTVQALGTHATVLVQEPGHIDLAERLLVDELNLIDRTLSRFRDDSELHMLHANAGHPVGVSELLYHAIDVACEVAKWTHGAVDPTVGTAIAALGYDRDLSDLVSRSAQSADVLGPVPGYLHVQLSPVDRTIRIPRGVRLDLGSSGKALAADGAANRIAEELGAGVLVSLGGDVAVAGVPPEGGWAVGIAVESKTPADEVDQVIAISHGGVASSSPGVRTWFSGDRRVHHIIDPRTGDCAGPYWTLVSACGVNCVEANAITTSSIVWGAAALELLSSFTQATRLVRHDGQVFYLNGWPEASMP
jgi:FAD:protein FMN transferase